MSSRRTPWEGSSAGQTRLTADVVDATVVTVAIVRRARIVTSDADDISRLADIAGARHAVIGV
jgi:hypothetical protein